MYKMPAETKIATPLIHIGASHAPMANCQPKTIRKKCTMATIPVITPTAKNKAYNSRSLKNN